MNIKEQIIEWQKAFKHENCFTSKALTEADEGLELVLFAIDNLTKEV